MPTLDWSNREEDLTKAARADLFMPLTWHGFLIEQWKV